jgi:hypothetical protein
MACLSHDLVRTRQFKVLGSVFAQSAYRGKLRLEKFALAHQRSTVTEIITLVLAAGLDLAEM